MSAPSPSRRQVPCPACGQPALFAPENPFRPFCSERCRQHDLGAWASENYRVGSREADDVGGAEQLPPAEH
ncbi:DNA gyrase inhibitor YacG [Caldimonas sp. KR1-144]|uniref:DNA gyrase inhibitor YacG n=1 Tax=Caldimonas sp. KR1-144 TaxID=3400911 RepID=UPI003C07A4DD